MNDSILERETERQRRLLQEAREAVKRQKTQLRGDGVHKMEPSLFEPGEPAPPTARTKDSVATPNTTSDGQVRAAAEPINKVCRIPGMRCALLPLGESREGAEWSNPFSLVKADMQPFLSFFRGYRESQLFSDSSASNSGHAEYENEPRVDAAIQALFALKGLDLKFILEPAVQINGPVEYVDPALETSQTDAVDEVHQKLLAKAVEEGKEMGNRLHDALLGEGRANLIDAWEKAYGRKPNMSELYRMLTSGSPKLEMEAGAQELEVKDRPKAATISEKDAVRTRPEVLSKKEEPLRKKTDALSHAFGALAKKFKPRDKRQFLFHLLHLGVCCAGLVVYYFVMRAIN